MAVTTSLLTSPVLVGVFCFVAIGYLITKSRRKGLEHIPGPSIARYTDAWRAYKAWSLSGHDDGSTYQSNLLGKYGDVIRIGPSTVLVQDPEAINSVLGFKERLEKAPSYNVFALSGT